MGDILQEKLGVKIEYIVGQNEMKINMEGNNNNYYARLDEILINPRIVNVNNLEIKKNSVKMDFKAPIMCNPENFDLSRSMMVGIKFEGEDKYAFIEKIEETARNFSPEWEEAVRKRKEEIQRRSIINR